MTSASGIKVGDKATVKSGRYAGRLVEVIELKSDKDSPSALCQFVPSGLSEREIKMQKEANEFEPTWFGLDILEPSTTHSTSDVRSTERA